MKEDRVREERKERGIHWRSSFIWLISCLFPEALSEKETLLLLPLNQYKCHHNVKMVLKLLWFTFSIKEVLDESIFRSHTAIYLSGRTSLTYFCIKFKIFLVFFFRIRIIGKFRYFKMSVSLTSVWRELWYYSNIYINIQRAIVSKH